MLKSINSNVIKSLHLCVCCCTLSFDLAKNSFYYNGSIIFNRLNFKCFFIIFVFTVTVYSPYFKINFS